MNLNKALLIGRLTADPQVRQTPGGQSVTTLGVATNRTWTDKAGTKQEETEFHNVVVWGRQAEVIGQFLAKGSTIFIEGRLQTRSWQDKQGQTRKTTEIIAERIQLGPRPMGAPRDVSGQNEMRQGKTGAPPGLQAEAQKAISEELPTIDMDEPGAGEIKPEDLPF